MMPRYKLRYIRFASYMNNIRANIDISSITIELNANILMHKNVVLVVDIVVLSTMLIICKFTNEVEVATWCKDIPYSSNKESLSTTCSPHSTQC